MSEPMTDERPYRLSSERRREIRARADAATQGPWLPEISMTDEMTAHYAIRTRDKLPEHPWSPRFIAWLTGFLRDVGQADGPPSTYCESCRHVCWRGREIAVDVRQDAQTEADAAFLANARQDVPDLLDELDLLDAELKVLESYAFRPAAGHWYVEEHSGGASWTNVGPVEDIEHGKLRVALQRAHDAACAAVQALRKTNPNCHYTVTDHTEHDGPCAMLPSSYDIVSTVLGTVARELRHPGEGER